MSAHGKRYNESRAKFDRETQYSPAEAFRILKELPDAKFDETVEAHFRLGLNVRHADQQLRGTLMLPHGTGKSVRVAVFAEGDKAREAEEAGADIVGAADLAAKIEGGFTDFDVAIATPDQMGNVGKLGRVLGPRGLMPNPKTGTVTFDIAKAVSDPRPASSSTAPTAAPTCTCRSARRASASGSCSRTTPSSSRRSPA
jgi:large subunit ribosomal protein L1